MKHTIFYIFVLFCGLSRRALGQTRDDSVTTEEARSVRMKAIIAELAEGSAWTPGGVHRTRPNVVAGAQRGVWEPQAGYEWIDPDDKDAGVGRATRDAKLGISVMTQVLSEETRLFYLVFDRVQPILEAFELPRRPWTRGPKLTFVPGKATNRVAVLLINNKVLDGMKSGEQVLQLIRKAKGDLTIVGFNVQQTQGWTIKFKPSR